MQVILLQDVKNYGKKDQVVEVSDGYAMNYLLPKKLAVKASQESINLLKSKIKKEDINKKADIEKTQKLKEAIEAITLNFKLAQKDGKSFGSVSQAQIEEKMLKEYQIKIDKRKLLKHENLNQIGLFYIKLKLDFNIEATINVKIESKE
ncbi:50S ribosomal protein L9 [Spiroplasma sabaudiense Ar-1343]|uniref:Large ribosomal subunit protein bL9 n=1 Tax=Spiroplasma sabaudiense Ar-1343 TaxID=1276257 RepID=W6A8U3_9MOLU|nr:50S ribosomal protein L9 [Spiroplasma sabaudiense]AHI53437.1 50S ribosomal protein L9 [Spiroplasma sabaudiense Ar-1343]